MPPQCIRGSLQIDRTPEHNSRHHQVGGLGIAAARNYSANSPQPVEEQSAGQSVAGFAVVQYRLGVLCDPNSDATPFSPVEGVQGNCELRRQISEHQKTGRALASAYVVHLGSWPGTCPIRCRSLLSKKRWGGGWTGVCPIGCRSLLSKKRQGGGWPGVCPIGCRSLLSKKRRGGGWSGTCSIGCHSLLSKKRRGGGRSGVCPIGCRSLLSKKRRGGSWSGVCPIRCRSLLSKKRQ